MNLATFIVLLIVVVIVGFAARSVYRSFKRGDPCGTCGNSCGGSGTDSCGSCRSRLNEEEIKAAVAGITEHEN